MYKMFGGLEWKTVTLATAFGFPGTVFTIFFTINLFIWYTGSSGAVSFGTMFSLIAMWFGVSVPLVFFGAWCGFKKDAVELPVRTN